MRQPSPTNYRPANRFRAKKGKKMQRETHRKCSRAGKPNRREEDILAGKGKRRAAWNKHIHVPRCFLLLVASQFALYLFYSPPCLCSPEYCREYNRPCSTCPSDPRPDGRRPGRKSTWPCSW